MAHLGNGEDPAAWVLCRTVCTNWVAAWPPSHGSGGWRLTPVSRPKTAAKSGLYPPCWHFLLAVFRNQCHCSTVKPQLGPRESLCWPLNLPCHVILCAVLRLVCCAPPQRAPTSTNTTPFYLARAKASQQSCAQATLRPPNSSLIRMSTSQSRCETSLHMAMTKYQSIRELPKTCRFVDCEVFTVLGVKI